jgi:hypothetical protein
VMQLSPRRETPPSASSRSSPHRRRDAICSACLHHLVRRRAILTGCAGRRRRGVRPRLGVARVFVCPGAAPSWEGHQCC